MAGPTAGVLLPTKLPEEFRGELRTRLRCGSPLGSDDDFLLEGEPFILDLRPRSPEQLIAEDPRVLGWAPQDAVSFAAMCNGHEDHRLLARLCLDIAEDFGGVVDFHGALPIGPHFDRTSLAKPVRVSNPDGLDGVLWATAYRTMWGDFATSHYGDVEFLRAWLGDPRFRMVK